MPVGAASEMRGRRQWVVATVLVLAGLAVAGRAQEQPGAPRIPTVWRDGGLWIAVREAAEALGFQVRYQAESDTVEATREGRQATASVDSGAAWRSADDRLFVPVRFLEELGYTVRWEAEANQAVVTWDDHTTVLTRQPKSIAVNLTRQVLFAREGDVLVYEFRVSTGKLGYGTPNGDYQVLSKEPLHLSRIYHNARMPYSLRFHGGYFIHGFTIVPHHPASHGCIRLTIPDAKTLYAWTPIGTPVRVYRSAKDEGAGAGPPQPDSAPLEGQ
jgi:hypothetical protein